MSLEHCKHCGREYERSQGKKLYCSPECSFRGKLVVKGPEDCWPWTAKTSLNWYGKIWLGDRHEKTHRYAYILHYGSIPEGMCVLHRCDNPICCNPKHLFLGDHKDNAIDRVNKGRHKGADKGSLNHNARLTETDVADIKRRLVLKQKHKDIGALYGISKHTVSGIRAGHRWAHVPFPPAPDREHPFSLGPFQEEEEKFPLL